MKREKSRKILEEKQLSNFIQIRLVATDLFHPERKKKRRTEMKNLRVAFRNFVSTHKD
jgi:hypothetical protein